MNQKTEPRISKYILLSTFICTSYICICIAGNDQSNLHMYQDGFDAGPRLSTTEGWPLWYSGTYVLNILVPLHTIARFRKKRRFFVVMLGADDACDWLYFHTRYLAEAERWKHGHFRRVKEQLLCVDKPHGTLMTVCFKLE